MSLVCFNCDTDLEDSEGFNCWEALLAPEVRCPTCGWRYKIGYEEFWDGQSEWQQWWLEELPVL